MKYSIQKRNSNEPLNLFDAFDDFFKPVFFDEYSNMKTDIQETKDGYHLDVELAGFKKEDINVTLEDGYLTVSADRKREDEDKSKSRYVKKEISESYKRSYYVGEDVKEEDVKAKYENGLLSLDIPKSQPRQIQSRSINIE